MGVSRFIASWLGLILLATGAALLLFPRLPARDPAGLPPHYAPLPWELGVGCLIVGMVLLAVGRLRRGC